MRRSAVIYAVNDRIIIGSSPKTTAGLRLHQNPTGLRVSDKAEAFTEALQWALHQSEEIVPHPQQTEWKGSFDPFVQAAGVRTFKAFMASARCVAIDEDDGGLHVIPHRNLGARDGFEEIDSERQTLSDIQAAAGSALKLLR